MTQEPITPTFSETSEEEIQRILQLQKAYFKSQETLSLSFRKRQLLKLAKGLKQYESEMLEALQADFRKSKFEGFITEVGLLQVEVRHMIRNLKQWAGPRTVSRFSMANFPATTKIHPHPYGVSLIIAPWNYPVQLALLPLMGAIAAGCCAIVKPSEYTPNCSKVMKKLLEELFEEKYVKMVQGGVKVSTHLLAQPVDHIFFTGSEAVGRLVSRAAGEKMIPVVLELGGKSPAIVAADANLAIAARRIVWAKFVNGGQTCVAPDYILADEKIKDALVGHMMDEVEKMYGKDPSKSPDYPRMVSDRHFERLVKMLDERKVVMGGEYTASDRYLAPTIMDHVTTEDAVMQEEIFGPILPVLTYQKAEELDALLDRYPNPLAQYVFSEDKAFAESLMSRRAFGGGAINDAVAHLAESSLPFGGIGHSGMGGYHGAYSVEAFSHMKGVMKKSSWLDLPFRYAPYRGKLSFMKQLFKWM
ncbi:aldehyde dehydrogenase family protein [Persicobacter sp. CCB-QB2]|uniref:aldehyde dehydrogenase family protein n=1 Tax=Persicobacter sp. CCB-QB2 TaxID=1561025 RepID=UPI0006A947FE|nr:aldehyde dehydrogenase family protein [Persicobacter sp. CCB-QB2]